MQPAEAGPSSPARSSPPALPTTSPTRTFATAPVEPYDSPLKRSPPTVPYAGEGGDLTDVLEDGDLGVRNSRRDKGKGKARLDDREYGRVRTTSEDVALEERDAEEAEVDEAAEERRIQENLARWSRADAQRRASLRRSTRLVYPSMPSAPPVDLPSPTSLVRRTSHLLRAGSRRRRGSNGLGGLEADEVELGGPASPVASPTEGGFSGRRGWRKLSVKIDAGGEDSASGSAGAAASGAGGLARVGEEPDDVDPARTPTTSPHAETDSLVTPVSARARDNPFSPSNASFVSLVSTASERTVRTGSRFIEDLPPLPASPPSATSSPSKPRPLSAQLVSTTPAASNPFVDVIVTSATPTRPDAVSRHSQQSVATFSAAGGASATNPLRAPSPSGSFVSSTSSRPYSPTPMPTAYYGRRAHADEGEEGEDRVGLLDWLLCGCFRTGAGQRDERVAQQGRTNPME
ncbi:uncharacterized protein JCM10292_000506 [Rhodotorula paludigena]|uniref:uncharacterized protein n=1 Tax=Rhodotorula paludigena TaxID=86838 RepID=UPI00316E28EF